MREGKMGMEKLPYTLGAICIEEFGRAVEERFSLLGDRVLLGEHCKSPVAVVRILFGKNADVSLPIRIRGINELLHSLSFCSKMRECPETCTDFLRLEYFRGVNILCDSRCCLSAECAYKQVHVFRKCICERVSHGGECPENVCHITGIHACNGGSFTHCSEECLRFLPVSDMSVTVEHYPLCECMHGAGEVSWLCSFHLVVHFLRRQA